MIFTQERTIAAEPARLWDFLMQVPRVAPCVPGVEAIEALDAGAYRGRLRIQVGPIRLALEGTITVEEEDRGAWRARMRAEANDRRLGGGIRARMSLALAPAPEGTRLRIETDLALLGKIGEFGQPIIKKKADAILEDFVRNIGVLIEMGGLERAPQAPLGGSGRPGEAGAPLGYPGIRKAPN